MNTPTFIKDNIEKIKSRDDVSFKILAPYYHERYSKNKYISDVLSDCPDKTINRELVKKYFNNKQELHGFYAAMIWGGISAGGITGDNLTKIINQDQSKIINIIQKANEMIINNNFASAFTYMNGDGKINGIGASYFTKLFFFLGQSNNQALIPPIFDKWTKLAYSVLAIEADDKEKMFSFVKKYKNGNIFFHSHIENKIYDDFCTDMNRWAKSSNVSTDNLERFIFGSDRRQDKSINNPRIYFLKQADTYFSKLNKT